MTPTINQRFNRHPATTDEQRDAHEALHTHVRSLATYISTHPHINNGGEQAIALTHLQDTLMWANKAIATHFLTQDTTGTQDAPDNDDPAPTPWHTSTYEQQKTTARTRNVNNYTPAELFQQVAAAYQERKTTNPTVDDLRALKDLNEAEKWERRNRYQDAMTDWECDPYDPREYSTFQEEWITDNPEDYTTLEEFMANKLEHTNHVHWVPTQPTPEPEPEPDLTEQRAAAARNFFDTAESATAIDNFNTISEQLAQESALKRAQAQARDANERAQRAREEARQAREEARQMQEVLDAAAGTFLAALYSDDQDDQDDDDDQWECCEECDTYWNDQDDDDQDQGDQVEDPYTITTLHYYYQQ